MRSVGWPTPTGTLWPSLPQVPTPVSSAMSLPIIRIRDTASRPVHFGGKAARTPAYARSALKAGNRIAGPALIEEHASTTVLLPGDRMHVDGFGNLVIEVGKKR